MEKIFVYGTLKSTYSNNSYYLNSAKRVGHDRIMGVLLHLGGCPALMHELTPLCKVSGEVYEVDMPTMARLDALEGVPHMYRRVKVATTKHGDVWTYKWAEDRPLTDHTMVVTHGLWRGGNLDRSAYKALKEFYSRYQAGEPVGSPIIVPSSALSVHVDTYAEKAKADREKALVVVPKLPEKQPQIGPGAEAL